MKSRPTLETAKGVTPVANPVLFVAVTSIWIFLVILKLGNPVILDAKVEPPENFLEFLYGSWPLRWGYLLFLPLILVSLRWWRRPALVGRVPLPGANWIVWLPLAWLGWQFLSSAQSVRGDLSSATCLHFAACAICFYVGLFCLSHVKDLRLFWFALIAALGLALWVGLNQHYGGLEATRRAFAEMQTNWSQFPPELKERLDTPEFRQKIASDRIFSTFVYPNAFAGGILLLFPITLLVLWQSTGKFFSILQKVIVGLFIYMAGACLYWSQSKAGWLIFLALGVIAFLHLPVAKKVKVTVAGLVLVAGISGFVLKHSGYFSRGATSAVARLDYWKAAWQIVKEKPALGSGPGTFMVGYKRIKSPEAEMTRLAHNDYLQQASDSGWPGFLLYGTFVWGSLGLLYGRFQIPPLGVHPSGCSVSSPTANPVLRTPFAVWLGLAGLALQSFVEFGLYIPALSWPFFLLLGWLWGNEPQNSGK